MVEERGDKGEIDDFLQPPQHEARAKKFATDVLTLRTSYLDLHIEADDFNQTGFELYSALANEYTILGEDENANEASAAYHQEEVSSAFKTSVFVMILGKDPQLISIAKDKIDTLAEKNKGEVHPGTGSTINSPILGWVNSTVYNFSGDRD